MMADSGQTDGGDFDAQKLAEEREESSLSLNPLRVGKYAGSILLFAFGFAILGAVLNFRILPVQFPALGVLSMGAIVGFAFINERSLSLPKQLMSMAGYLVFAYIGVWLFPLFLPFRMRFSVLAIILILSAVAGGFIWYYLRTEILSANFE